MEYKVHKYRYDNFHKFEEIIKQSLESLGYTDSDKSSKKHIPTVNVYNHCHVTEVSNPNRPIIFKPTGPTSKHFALDTLGYANASTLAFEKPDLNPDIEQMDWASIIDLKNSRCNKWDDSILLKWKVGKDIPDNHILIICQMPDDETVKGFGFGRHFEKVHDIVMKLYSLKENFVVKMHPRWKARTKYEIDLLKNWKSKEIDVRMGYDSIHDYLRKARMVIVDNSTSGIEALMHEVPVISYGWPEYHWATKKLQTLTQLERLVDDTSWWKQIYARQFTEWYINHYLCTDINNTVRRLKELL